MAKPFLLIYLLTLLSNTLSSYQLDEFFFNNFNNVGANITLNGVAMVEKNGIIQLTNHTSRLLGHAFYQSPVRFKNMSTGKALSFSTAFAFAIVPEYPRLGGHGLAFTISPTKELKGALPSQYLGLLNATDNKNFSNHIFAVEFDTVQDFEFGDINDNHIGIDINSMVSNASVAASYFINDTATETLLLKSGKTIQAWIDYDSNRNELGVRLSLTSVKPKLPILSFDVDLATIFQDFMYVGFSASTGLLASSHYILGWRFNMNGEAKSLSLQSLPSLPQPKEAKSNTPMIAGVSVSATIFLIFIIAMALYIARKIKNADVIEAWEMNVGPHRFSYRELKKATRGFKDKQLLGFGGFGKVYKGTLKNSKTNIAVKRISHESKQGVREFASEIASIGRLRHRNLVQLQGWCRRRSDLLLVYDFMPNGSLDKYLFQNPKWILSWEQRFKIIKGVATGLLYLHEEWEQTVIHRDIKAGNVLLDSDFNGRLGDFGLAKLYEHGSNPSTTRVVGTLGYLAPELTRTGKPTTSSDVFAFGALLLEVVCGRRPIEANALPEELILVDWVWESWKEGIVLTVVDKRLEGHFDETEAIIVLKLGLICSNSTPQARPSMKQVVRYLEGEAVLPEVLMSPDVHHKKPKGGGGGAGCSLEFEDFLHSYPSSSGFEKASAWSEGEVGMEATTPMSLPRGGGNATGR